MKKSVWIYLLLALVPAQAANIHTSTEQSEAVDSAEVAVRKGLKYFCDTRNGVVHVCEVQDNLAAKECGIEKRVVKVANFSNQIFKEIYSRKTKRNDVAKILSDLGGSALGKIENLDDPANGKMVVNALARVCDTQVADKLNQKQDKESIIQTVLELYNPSSGANSETAKDGMLEFYKRDLDEDGRNRDFWKDSSTGIVWGPVEDSEKIKEFQKNKKLIYVYDGRKRPDNARAAEEFCKSKSMELPTKQDFLNALNNPQAKKVGVKGENQGRNDLLKSKLPGMSHKWFWTATPVLGVDYNAVGFDGEQGAISSGFRDNSFFSVRCIIRPKKSI